LNRLSYWNLSDASPLNGKVPGYDLSICKKISVASKPFLD
jgi:hypothetical protein